MNSMETSFLLSWIFLKIGATSFGGAYSIWALVRQEFVERAPGMGNLSALSTDQFYNFMEVGQLTPGPNINGVLLIGNHYLGLPGIFLVLLGLLLPSILLMMGYYHLNLKLKNYHSFTLIKKGALAAIIGILIFFLIKLADRIPQSILPETLLFGGLTLISLYLIHFRKFNVIITTLLSGLIFWGYAQIF